MGIETAAAFGADAAPLPDEEGVVEEVGPDLPGIEAPFVPLGPDAGQGDAVGEERQLGGYGPSVAVAHEENLGRLGDNAREV